MNARVKVIFALLKPRSASRHQGRKGLCRYRLSQCKGDSMYATGTERSAQFAYCLTAENREHLKALAAVRWCFLDAERCSGVIAGRWPSRVPFVLANR